MDHVSEFVPEPAPRSDGNTNTGAEGQSLQSGLNDSKSSADEGGISELEAIARRADALREQIQIMSLANGIDSPLTRSVKDPASPSSPLSVSLARLGSQSSPSVGSRFSSDSSQITLEQLRAEHRALSDEIQRERDAIKHAQRRDRQSVTNLKSSSSPATSARKPSIGLSSAPDPVEPNQVPMWPFAGDADGTLVSVKVDGRRRKGSLQHIAFTPEAPATAGSAQPRRGSAPALGRSPPRTPPSPTELILPPKDALSPSGGSQVKPLSPPRRPVHVSFDTYTASPVSPTNLQQPSQRSSSSIVSPPPVSTSVSVELPHTVRSITPPRSLSPLRDLSPRKMLPDIPSPPPEGPRIGPDQLKGGMQEDSQSVSQPSSTAPADAAVETPVSAQETSPEQKPVNVRRMKQEYERKVAAQLTSMKPQRRPSSPKIEVTVPQVFSSVPVLEADPSRAIVLPARNPSPHTETRVKQLQQEKPPISPVRRPKVPALDLQSPSAQKVDVQTPVPADTVAPVPTSSSGRSSPEAWSRHSSRSVSPIVSRVFDVSSVSAAPARTSPKTVAQPKRARSAELVRRRSTEKRRFRSHSREIMAIHTANDLRTFAQQLQAMREHREMVHKQLHESTMRQAQIVRAAVSLTLSSGVVTSSGPVAQRKGSGRVASNSHQLDEQRTHLQAQQQQLQQRRKMVRAHEAELKERQETLAKRKKQLALDERKLDDASTDYPLTQEKARKLEEERARVRATQREVAVQAEKLEAERASLLREQKALHEREQTVAQLAASVAQGRLKLQEMQQQQENERQSLAQRQRQTLRAAESLEADRMKLVEEDGRLKQQELAVQQLERTVQLRKLSLESELADRQQDSLPTHETRAYHSNDTASAGTESRTLLEQRLLRKSLQLHEGLGEKPELFVTFSEVGSVPLRELEEHLDYLKRQYDEKFPGKRPQPSRDDAVQKAVDTVTAGFQKQLRELEAQYQVKLREELTKIRAEQQQERDMLQSLLELQQKQQPVNRLTSLGEPPVDIPQPSRRIDAASPDTVMRRSLALQVQQQLVGERLEQLAPIAPGATLPAPVSPVVLSGPTPARTPAVTRKRIVFSPGRVRRAEEQRSKSAGRPRKSDPGISATANSPTQTVTGFGPRRQSIISIERSWLHQGKSHASMQASAAHTATPAHTGAKQPVQQPHSAQKSRRVSNLAASNA